MTLFFDFIVHEDLAVYLDQIPYDQTVETIAMNDRGILVAVDDAE